MKWLAGLGLCVALIACAPLAIPKTPRQAYAEIEGDFTALVAAATAARAAGQLSGAAESRVDEAIHEVDGALALARALLVQGRSDAALATLATAATQLSDLQQAVKNHE